MAEHRSSERSLYDKLRADEHQAAREFLEGLLDTDKTYPQICWEWNASSISNGIAVLTPQALSRYRQRKHREETRADVMALIETETETLLDAATRSPMGVVAKYLRKTLAEEAVKRFDAEIGDLKVKELSIEAARHAGVEQADRKLDLDREKLELDRKRVEIAERQAAAGSDRFEIAVQVWKAVLTWLVGEEPDIADRLTARSEELVVFIEEYVGAMG